MFLRQYFTRVHICFKSVQNRTTIHIKNHDYLIVFTRDRFEAYLNVNVTGLVIDFKANNLLRSLWLYITFVANCFVTNNLYIFCCINKFKSSKIFVLSSLLTNYYCNSRLGKPSKNVISSKENALLDCQSKKICYSIYTYFFLSFLRNYIL